MVKMKSMLLHNYNKSLHRRKYKERDGELRNETPLPTKVVEAHRKHGC